MKLTWSPESAASAYLAAVDLLPPSSPDSDLAELVAAMAGGFSPTLILDATSAASTSTPLALLAASRISGARLVRLPPPAAGAAAELDGVDFAVVDCDREDAGAILRALRVGPRGAVVVCKGGGGGGRWWRRVVRAGNRVVRSAVLPIEKGVEILHVGVGKGPSLAVSDGAGRSRWIKHVDRDTGEEHVFRR